MIKTNKTTASDILMLMVEEIGIETVLEEMTQQMSTDELCNMISGLDQYLFSNHYSECIDEGLMF